MAAAAPGHGELPAMDRLSNSLATAGGELSRAGEIITDLAARPVEGLAPAWAVQLQRSIDRLQTGMNRLQTDVTSVETKVTALQRGLLDVRTEARREKILAQLREENREARDANRFAQLSSGHLRGLKRLPDIDPLVDGVRAPPEPELLDPPPGFPETFNAIDTHSRRDIEPLMRAYGQETPRGLEEARRALKKFIT